MYFNILKKDLKRKKTMNIILLIFIVLASTFISSSANNLLTITTALDSYFNKAGLSDFLIMTMEDEKNDVGMKEFLDNNKNVENWTKDDNIFISADDITHLNGKEITMDNIGILSSIQIQQQKFFDNKDEEIKQVKDGEVYLPLSFMEENDLERGDVIAISKGNIDRDFRIAGNCKDAFLGSVMMGNSRFIISDNDYKTLAHGSDFLKGSIYSIDAFKVDALVNDYNQMEYNELSSGDRNMIKTTYVMDMVIAAILLVVSICLILISMVILRFTIMFTLAEEFREIGIMKAIGIRPQKIRGIYIVKYFAISFAGAIVGAVLSIPFGNMFLRKISRNIIMSGEKYSFIINFGCSVFIVGLVLIFCYGCTRRVNKVSAIIAIRAGSSGERYKRKGLLRLGTCKISTILFMAVNDILSGLRKFGVLMITFTLGSILVIVPINTVNTLDSGELVSLFGMAVSDAYLLNEGQQAKFISNDRAYLSEYLLDMEAALRKNGMNASVSCNMVFRYKVSKDSKSESAFALQGVGITADKFAYIKGQPPKYENEIALTHITAKKIGADIGDKVKMKLGETEETFIVTALFQSMNNFGEGLRISEKKEFVYDQAIGSMPIQITFHDSPSEEEVSNRLNKIKYLFPKFDVNEGREYINEITDGIVEQFESLKQLIVLVIIGINILVAVLMVKTFITKETGEIAMLKSIGFRNSSIIKWQISRIGIILVVSIVLGALLSNPIAQISSGRIFEMMGANKVKFIIKPMEVYVIYPLIIFTLTMAASAVTALQIRKIKTQETNNIE